MYTQFSALESCSGNYGTLVTSKLMLALTRCSRPWRLLQKRDLRLQNKVSHLAQCLLLALDEE